MKIFKHSQISDKTKTIITYLIFIIFAVYSINIIIETNELYAKIIFAVIAGIFLTIAILGEYLKILHRKMVVALAYDLNPTASLVYKNKLVQFDIFKQYRDLDITYDTLYNIDTGRFQENLDLLASKSDTYHESFDAKLVYEFTAFYSNYRLDNRTQAKQHYKKLKQIQNMKTKKKKGIKPIYSWDFIDGVYYRLTNDDKKSFHSFEKVNLNQMNNREAALFFLECIPVAKNVASKTRIETLMDDAKRLKGDSLTVQKIANQ